MRMTHRLRENACVITDNYRSAQKNSHQVRLADWDKLFSTPHDPTGTEVPEAGRHGSGACTKGGTEHRGALETLSSENSRAALKKFRDTAG